MTGHPVRASPKNTEMGVSQQTQTVTSAAREMRKEAAVKSEVKCALTAERALQRLHSQVFKYISRCRGERHELLKSAE